MKLQKNPLQPDDHISVSVSHQIYINGDQSWVKLEAMSKVREGELAKEAIARVGDLVNDQIMEVIGTTVKTIEENK